MADLLDKAVSAPYHEGFAAGLAFIGLFFFVFVLIRRPSAGRIVLVLGLTVMLVSHGLAFCAETWDLRLPVFRADHEYHTAVFIGAPNYLGFPLIILGAMLEVAAQVRVIRAKDGVLSGQEGRVRDLARAMEESVGLEYSLAAANRDLQSARDEIKKSSSEASRVSSKLRETLNLLLSSEEKFRSIFERANDGFVLADGQSRRITQANPRMAALTGYGAGELAGVGLGDVFGTEVTEDALADSRALASRGFVSPVNLRRKDASTLPVEVSFTLIDVGGMPLILGVARDVTERERLLGAVELKNEALEAANLKLSERADKMREMNRKLRELQGVKDNFLSSVSHELRTPLTSIRSFSEILLQYQDAEESVKQEFIGIINAESERLTRLIDDVLDIARIEAGEMKFEPTVLDLPALVRDVAKSLSPISDKRGVEVKILLPRSLPKVDGDRDRLHQVLTNLLSNALKFSGEGTSVEVGARIDGAGMLEVAIRDHGPGIPAEHLERIFEKFRQVEDNRAGKPQGTGLGLAICREIISLHGGRIWCRSKLGEGSTFHFTVRRAPPVELSPEAAAVAAKARAAKLRPEPGTASPLAPAAGAKRGLVRAAVARGPAGEEPAATSADASRTRARPVASLKPLTPDRAPPGRILRPLRQEMPPQE